MSIRNYLLISLAAAATSPAQDTADKHLEGHSYHGEAFNEGPRQRAYLMGGTGDVNLPVTTKNQRAQKYFNQGLGQLHGFWYFEAERSFRQTAAIDPDCAMAYWGMAMANPNAEDRAAKFAHEAWARRTKASAHERHYIESLARFYAVDKEPPTDKSSPEDKPEQPDKKKPVPKEKDIARRKQWIADTEKLIYEFPDDTEAKALLVNQLWLNTRKGIPPVSRQANQALLDQVFAANPMHPAHHYRIHLWDKKGTAYRVVDSAIQSGQSAPRIAHMWHMGGHTFDKLTRYADSAWQQEASARVDHAQMMRDQIMPFMIHNYAHNNEWLVRSLCRIGRVDDAIDLAMNMVELPRHPEKNHLQRRGRSAAYGRDRLINTLSMFEQWEKVIELAETMYLEPGKALSDQAARISALGEANVALGKLDRAKENLQALRKLAESESQDKPEETEKPAPDKKKSDKKKSGTRREIDKRVQILEALLSFNEGQHDKATEKLTKARYSNLHLSRMYLETGNATKAEKAARSAAKNKTNMACETANLAFVLWACGKRDEAAKLFKDLRNASARFDMNMPVFQRLAPIANSLDLPGDWRVSQGLASDTGERPELPSLGPFRWAPTPAPAWSAQNSTGQTISLADFSGKPVLLIYFLGFGCVHCVEQLNAIKPLVDAFTDAGISIVTIGTDTASQVKESVGRGGDFPFPILCDPEHEVFKTYRVWDDFESTPLHGTFLLDGDGLIRWQDISHEPFVKIQFLLEECKRLLALPPR